MLSPKVRKLSQALLSCIAAALVPWRLKTEPIDACLWSHCRVVEPTDPVPGGVLAFARVHLQWSRRGMGQQESVNVHYLIAKDTLDVSRLQAVPIRQDRSSDFESPIALSTKQHRKAYTRCWNESSTMWASWSMGRRSPSSARMCSDHVPVY